MIDWNDLSSADVVRHQLKHHKLVIGCRVKLTPLGKFIFDYPGRCDREKIHNFIFDIRHPPKCFMCDKLALFSGPLKRYQHWCSSLSHSQLHPTTIEKKYNTITTRYGVDSIFHSSAVRSKIKSTMMTRFGGHQMLHPTVSGKRSATLRKRHGGVGLASSTINEKIKSTMIERHGAQHNWKSPALVQGYLDKRKELFLRYRLAYFKDCGVVPLFNLDEYIGYAEESRWRCVKCEIDFFGKMNHGIPRCPKCNPGGSSAPERSIAEFIEGLSVDIKRGARIFTNDSRSVDIYVPSRQLAFEYNGLCFHSEISLWKGSPGKDKITTATKRRPAAASEFN